MIITARQLEDLHRSHGGNGLVTVPYRARLTPLAVDWARAKKVSVGYGDVPPANGSAAAAVPSAAPSAPAAGSFVWWCDGPCGPAKAAVVAEEKQSQLAPLEHPADPRQLVAVIKSIALGVKSGKTAGGVILVSNGAAAVVFANRCPSLRAILGTSLEAVEQGVRNIAANVLVVEYPRLTMQQTRNLLSRFLRSPRTLDEQTRRQIEELAACG